MSSFFQVIDQKVPKDAPKLQLLLVFSFTLHNLVVETPLLETPHTYIIQLREIKLVLT